MSISIKDGASGNVQTVDKSSRAHTFSVTRGSGQQAAADKSAWNINSGLVTLTTPGESGVFYFKNVESFNVDVASIVVILGPSTGGVTTDTTQVRVYKNPTAGTLISNAVTAGVIVENRDFDAGAASQLNNSLAYVGVEGDTITDGTLYISIAVSYEPNDSNTSMKCMVALICHKQLDTSIK
jgi:hypothetical protein